MGTVGLLYVGAVLFINGISLMGLVKTGGATPINWFVGFMQVVTPTYLIFTAQGNPDVIFGAGGLYLFGFTYLYVALGDTWGSHATGLGYFSLFVAIIASAYAVSYLVKYQQWTNAVSWALWAYLWLLFFLVNGLGKSTLVWFTGLSAALQGWLTAAIPAFFGLSGLGAVIPDACYAAAELILFIFLAGFISKLRRSAVRETLVGAAPEVR